MTSVAIPRRAVINYKLGTPSGHLIIDGYKLLSPQLLLLVAVFQHKEKQCSDMRMRILAHDHIARYIHRETCLANY